MEGYKKRGIQEMRDSGLEGYRKRGIQESRVQEGRVQDRRDVEQ